MYARASASSLSRSALFVTVPARGRSDERICAHLVDTNAVSTYELLTLLHKLSKVATATLEAIGSLTRSNGADAHPVSPAISSTRHDFLIRARSCRKDELDHL